MFHTTTASGPPRIKIPFPEFRWIGHYVIEKVYSPQVNSNKTQILHRIRLRKVKPKTTLQDVRQEGNLPADDEINIAQDELYIISLETDFEDLFTISDLENTSDKYSVVLISKTL